MLSSSLLDKIFSTDRSRGISSEAGRWDLAVGYAFMGARPDRRTFLKLASAGTTLGSVARASTDVETISALLTLEGAGDGLRSQTCAVSARAIGPHFVRKKPAMAKSSVGISITKSQFQ